MNWNDTPRGRFMTTLLQAVAFTVIGSEIAIAASPDQWKGLAIGDATLEQARAALGMTKTESLTRLITPFPIDQSKSKSFTRVRYLKPDGFLGADLFFKAGKLVALYLYPSPDNRIMMSDLSSIYDGAEFKPLGGFGDSVTFTITERTVLVAVVSPVRGRGVAQLQYFSRTLEKAEVKNQTLK